MLLGACGEKNTMNQSGILRVSEKITFIIRPSIPVGLLHQVTRRVLMSTACIVLGCIGLVLFGSHESKQFTVDELMVLYHRLQQFI